MNSDNSNEKSSQIQSFSIEFVEDQNEFFNTIENLNKNVDINSLEIIKLSSITKASNLISNVIFLSNIFDKFPLLIALRLKIDENLNENEIPRKFKFQDRNRFLLSFESTSQNQVLIFFKNNQNEEFFEIALLTNEIAAEIKLLAIEFITVTFTEKEGKIAFYSNQKFDLSTLISNTYSNLLFEAVLKNDLNLVKKVLKLSIDVNWKMNTYLAIDFAWLQNNQEIVLELLKNNSMYPKDFDDSKILEKKVEEFIEIGTNMFEAIRNKDLDKITKIIDENPKLRYFFNIRNLSAINFAIKKEFFEIYEILCKHNVTFGPDESFAKVSNQDFKMKLHSYNTKNAKKLPKVHIMLLISKSILSQSDENYNQRMDEIKNAFETLDEIKEIKPMLKLLALDRKLKFFFDFTQNSIIYINPAVRQITRGLFIPAQHQIEIAAKKLTMKDTKNDSQASLAHECFHKAFEMVFKNERLPYGIDDEQNKAKFNEILKNCENFSKEDLIIDNVYNGTYDVEAKGRELAVRVPHILTYYQNDEVKLEKLKKIFKNLFDYHEKIVLPAIRAAIKIYEKLYDDDYKITYCELTEPLKSTIKHSNVEFQGFKFLKYFENNEEKERRIKLKDIVESNQEIYEILTSVQIRKILNGHEIILRSKKDIVINEFYKERKFISTDYDEEILKWHTQKEEFYLTQNAENDSKNYETLLIDVNETKNFILSDHAGTGKSTAFIHLGMKIKEKMPQNWISVIDLKKYFEVYKNVEIQNNSDVEKIIKILIEILSITDFDIIIFQHLFNSGRVALFFDGVDEIAPKYEIFFLKLIKNIRNLTNNQQWIATRPEHEEKLEEILNHEISFKLLPFDTKEAIEFAKEYLEFRKCTKDQNEVIKVIKELEIHENLMIMTMVVDLHIKGNVLTDNFNRYSLYEAMIKMKKEILAEKGSVANLERDIDSRINIWEILQIYAIKLLFEDEKFEDYLTENFFKAKNDDDDYEKVLIDMKNFKLFKTWQYEISKNTKWTPEAVSRTGLLTIFDWENHYEFMHKTYAEFFVAKFVVENVSEAIEDGNALIDLNLMSEKEFEFRMKLALCMFKEFCERKLNERNVVLDFIYVALPNLRKLKVCEKFYEFLERKEIETFIEKFFCDFEFTEYRPIELISRFIQFSDYDQRIFNALTLTKNGRSKLFEKALNDEKMCLLLCAQIFDILKMSKDENWHHLSGLGLKFPTNELNLPTNEELECLATNDFITKVKIFENYDEKFWKIDRFNDEEEIENFKKILQFLSFIIEIDDLSLKVVEKLIENCIFCHSSFWFFKSKKLMEIFFKIAEKYFKDEKRKFSLIVKEFGSFVADNLIEHKIVKDSEFLINFETFYKKVEAFLDENFSFMQIVLKDKDEYILFFVITNNLKFFKNLYQKYFDKKQFYKLIFNSFNHNKYRIGANDEINIFDEISQGISDFPNYFQFTFNHCCGFSQILETVSFYKENFTENWQKLTNYSERSEEIQKTYLEDTEVEKFANEAFPDGENLFFNAISQETSREKFLSFYELFKLIDSFKISKNELKNFFRNNLSQILDFAFKSHKILVEKIQETFKYLEKYEKICKFDLKLDQISFITGAQYFDIVKSLDYEIWLKVIEFDINEENLKIPTEEELEKFVNEDFLTKNQVIKDYKTGISQFDEWKNQEMENKLFKQIFQFLLIVDYCENFKFELIENFAVKFSLLTLRSKKIIEIFFKIAVKHFKSDKKKFAEILNNFCSSAFYSLLKYKKHEIGAKFLENFGNFHQKVEIFLQADKNLMQVVLSESKNFSFSFVNEIESVKKLYKKYFKIDDICDFAIKIFQNSEYHFYIVKSIEAFNVLCIENFELPNIFQFFAYHCCDLKKTLSFIDIFKIARANKTGWQNYINYKPKESFIPKNKILNQKELENILSSKLTNDEQKNSCADFVNFYQLLCYIDQHEIPQKHIENFLKNNLEQILQFAKSNEQILIEKVDETLSYINSYDEISKCFTN